MKLKYAGPPVGREFKLAGNVLTVGAVYEVHVVGMWGAVIDVYIYDDLGVLTFFDAAAFETVDPTIPGDWICSVFGGDPPRLVMGPRHIAISIDAYEAFVECR